MPRLFGLLHSLHRRDHEDQVKSTECWLSEKVGESLLLSGTSTLLSPMKGSSLLATKSSPASHPSFLLFPHKILYIYKSSKSSQPQDLRQGSSAYIESA